MYRVIIVDDQPEFLGWLKSLLKGNEDFQVVGEATTGVEALQLVKSMVPDLVIADVYIPEPDGLELARYIRQHFPSIKVILISAHAERVCERMAKEEGALTFIPKVKLSLQSLCQVLQAER